MNFYLSIWLSIYLFSYRSINLSIYTNFIHESNLCFAIFSWFPTMYLCSYLSLYLSKYIDIWNNLFIYAIQILKKLSSYLFCYWISNLSNFIHKSNFIFAIFSWFSFYLYISIYLGLRIGGLLAEWTWPHSLWSLAFSGLYSLSCHSIYR